MSTPTTGLAETLVRAFTVGSEFVTKSRTVLKIVEIQTAAVTLATGELVAGDPFYGLDQPPYSERLAPGRYAVDFPIADVPGRWGERVAFARLRVREEAATIYEPANPPSFGTDLAAACFMDAEFATRLVSLGKAESQAQYDRLSQEVDDCQGHWLETTVPGAEGQRFLVFASGLGDGGYNSYYGRNAKGELCCIVLDFDIVPHAELPKKTPKRKPWWRFC